MCQSGDHEVPKVVDPDFSVGWPERLRFSKLVGHDGRFGPAGDLRALTGAFVLRHWRHQPEGQFQIALQSIAAHLWREKDGPQA